MAKRGQAFQFWHEKERVVGHGERGSSITIPRQSPKPHSPRLSRTMLPQIDVCKSSPPSYRRNQHLHVGSNEKSGIVANLKVKWEHSPERGWQERAGRKSSQSPPQIRALHKPLRKANSLSPPTRRTEAISKLSPAVKNDVRASVASTTSHRADSVKPLTQHPDRAFPKTAGIKKSPPTGRVSMLVKKIEPSLSSSTFEMSRSARDDLTMHASVVTQVLDKDLAYITVQILGFFHSYHRQNLK